jgi:hypothetical protein
LRRTWSPSASSWLSSAASAKNGLVTIIGQALRSHLRGRHDVEANQLRAFVNVLQAKSGNGVDPIIATRLIAYANDLIGAGG